MLDTAGTPVPPAAIGQMLERPHRWPIVQSIRSCCGQPMARSGPHATVGEKWAARRGAKLRDDWAGLTSWPG